MSFYDKWPSCSVENELWCLWFLSLIALWYHHICFHDWLCLSLSHRTKAPWRHTFWPSVLAALVSRSTHRWMKLPMSRATFLDMSQSLELSPIFRPCSSPLNKMKVESVRVWLSHHVILLTESFDQELKEISRDTLRNCGTGIRDHTMKTENCHGCNLVVRQGYHRDNFWFSE